MNTRSIFTRITSLLLAIALLTGTALTLTGCNTTAGAGKDIQAVGKGIESGAENAK